MKNSFNYSGFCRSAYSAIRKKKKQAVAAKTATSTAVDRSCPPYLALAPVVRNSKSPV